MMQPSIGADVPVRGCILLNRLTQGKQMNYSGRNYSYCKRIRTNTVTQTLIITMVCLTLFAVKTMACNSPVFRYALLKWLPDQYQCIVYHRGPLTAKQEAVADRMKNSIGSPEFLNCFTRKIDISGTLTDQEQTVTDSLPEGTMPCIALYHPLLRYGNKPFFRGPLTMKTVDNILKSPARQALTEELVSGNAGIWLLITSPDREKNRRAKETLSASIKLMEDSCALPGQKTAAEKSVQEGKVPFRIAFSLMTLSLDDPKEVVLRNILQTVPGFPATDDEPVAILLFGRGRMHVPPLVGEHIADSSLFAAYRYILGMCSCVEKEQNPGEDLLLAVDWGAILAGETGSAEEMPNLMSPAAYLEVVENTIGPTTPALDTLRLDTLRTIRTIEPPQRKSQFTILYIVSIGVLLILFIVLPLVLIRRRSDRTDKRP